MELTPRVDTITSPELLPSAPLTPPEYPVPFEGADRDEWRLRVHNELNNYITASHNFGPTLDGALAEIRASFEAQLAGKPAEEIDAAFERAKSSFLASGNGKMQAAYAAGEAKKAAAEQSLAAVLAEGDPYETAEIIGMRLNASVRNRTANTASLHGSISTADKANARHTRAKLDLIERGLTSDTLGSGALGAVHAGNYAAAKQLEMETANNALAGREKTAELTEADTVLLAHLREKVILERAEKIRGAVETATQISESLNSWTFGSDTDMSIQGNIHQRLEQLSAQINGLPKYEPERERLVKSWVQLSVRYKQRQAFLGSGDTLPAFDTAEAVVVNTPGGPVVMHDDGSVSRNEMGQTVRRKPNGTIWLPEINTIAREPEYVEALQEMSEGELEKSWIDTMNNWETHRTEESKTAAAHTTRILSERMDANLRALSDSHSLAVEAARSAEEHLAAAAAGFDEQVRERLSNVDDPYDPRAGETIRAAVMAHIKNLADVSKMRAEAEENLRNQVSAYTTRTNRVHYWQGFVATMRYKEADGRAPTSVSGHDEEKPARILPDRSVAMKQITLNGLTGNWVIKPGGGAELHDPLTGTVRKFKANGEEIIPLP